MPRENDRVEWYIDGKGEYRWHRLAANNEIISESGEGYVNKDEMLEMAASLNPGIEIRERD